MGNLRLSFLIKNSLIHHRFDSADGLAIWRVRFFNFYEKIKQC